MNIKFNEYTHYIINKKRRNRSQIDLFMWKRYRIKIVKYCKVIPGESIIIQHRLMIMMYGY
jgi:hypothetical protein